MFVEIITPEKKLYSGDAKAVTLPGSDGSLGILNNHAPLITSLKKGIVKVTEQPSNSVVNFDIKGGVVEVLNNKVIILAE